MKVKMILSVKDLSDMKYEMGELAKFAMDFGIDLEVVYKEENT